MLCASEDSNMNQTYSMCVCFVHSVIIKPFMSSYDFILSSSRFRIIEMRWTNSYLDETWMQIWKAKVWLNCICAKLPYTHRVNAQLHLNHIWIFLFALKNKFFIIFVSFIYITLMIEKWLVQFSSVQTHGFMCLSLSLSLVLFPFYIFAHSKWCVVRTKSIQ